MMRLGTLVLILALATAALADPRMWEPSGKVVRGEAPVGVSSSVMDANAMTLIVWVDYETGRGDVWGQLVDMMGLPQWEPHGRRLIASEVGERDINVYTWQDGYLLTFTRANNGWNGYDLFMLRLDSQGNSLWQENDGTGIRVSHFGVSGAALHALRILQDGSVAFAYADWDPWGESFVLYANRVDLNGQLAFGEPLELLPYAGLGTDFAVDFDAAGSIFFAWDERVTSDSTSYHVRSLSNAGEVTWDHEYVTEAGSQAAMTARYVDNEGFYVAWAEATQESFQLKLQLYNANGLTLWQSPTILESSSAGGRFPRLLPSTTNGQAAGVIASWQTQTVAPSDSGGLMVQKIDQGGSPLWQTGGINLCTRVDYYSVSKYSMISDDQGGILTMLSLYFHNGVDWVYETGLSRLGWTGDFLWGEDCGTRVTTTDDNVGWLSVASGNSNNIIVSWATRVDTNIVKSVAYNKQVGQPIVPTDGWTWASGILGSVYDLTGLPLDNNRAAVLWEDTRVNYTDNLYFQIFNSSGQAALEPFGRPVFSEAVEAGSPEFAACPDGHGGFYAVQAWTWDHTGFLKVGHVDSNGDVTGDTLIVDVYANHPSMTPYCVAQTGGYGCYVVWNQAEGGSSYKQLAWLVDSTCTPQWSEPLTLGTESSSYAIGDVAAMPNGNCVVLLSTDTYTLGGANVNAEAHLEWMTNVTTTARLSSVQTCDVTVDNAGNIIAVWQDRRNSTTYPDVYGQRLSMYGVAQLADSGVLLAEHTEDFMLNPVQVMYDQGVWLLFAIQNTGGLNNTLYANKFTDDLQPAIGAVGIPLSVNDEFVFSYSAITDGAGGVIVSWGSNPAEGSSIAVAMHLNRRGEQTIGYWETGGSVICDTLAEQFRPVVVRGSEGDQFYCFWEDSRTYDQVYGQYLDEATISVDPPGEPVITDFSLSQNYPNPFNAATEIEFALPQSSDIVLNVYDVTGRLAQTVASGKFAAGEHRVNFDAAGLSSGVYFYQLRTGNTKIARKMVLLK